MRTDRSNNRNIQSMKRREFFQISSAMMNMRPRRSSVLANDDMERGWREVTGGACAGCTDHSFPR
jgi:hypothetical protein